MKYRNIDRNVRSTVTVAYIGYNIWRRCRVEVTSVGLAHARPIMMIWKSAQMYGLCGARQGSPQLGECSTLWGERERGSVVGVYVSSHRKLIGHIGCCRTESSASSLLRWSCAYCLKRVASGLSDVPLSVATYIVGGKLGYN